MNVSVVVPAYNEEERIANVLKVLIHSNLINEIIVIDDGSIDNTSQNALGYGVKLVRLPDNRGKSEAVKIGLNLCQEEVVLMLDADLIGLNEEHIRGLVYPIIHEDIDMTIGVFRGGRMLTDLAQLISPNLSGQRAFKRELIGEIIQLDTDGYSMELALSKYIKRKNLRTKKVVLYNISHVIKEEKLGFIKGTMWRFKMYKEIIKCWLN